MPWDLLLLPLLGGFWFVTLYYGTRFRAIQATREKLLFYAATVGVILGLVARVLSYHFDLYFPTFSGFLKIYFPAENLGTAFTALILGPLIAAILNRATSRELANKKAIRRWGDELERLLLEAQESKDFIVFTLKSSKVYVGLVYEVPANLDGTCAWIALVPFQSGYRDPKTKKMHLPTNYTKTLVEYAYADGGSEQKYIRVIPVDQVEVCGRFEQDIWDKFQSQATATGVAAGKEDQEDESINELDSDIAPTRK